MARRRVTGTPSPRVEDTALQAFIDSVRNQLVSISNEVRALALTSGTGTTTTIVQGPGGGTGTTPTPSGPGVPEFDVPPQPMNLEVNAGINAVMVSWANPFEFYSNHARAVVFRNTVNRFDTAAMIGVSEWVIYVDQDVQNNTTYFYWVQFESTANVVGPISDSASDTTGTSAEEFYEKLVEDVERSPLTRALRADIERPGYLSDEISRIAALRTAILGDLLGLTAGVANDALSDANAANTVAGVLGANLGYGWLPGPEPNIFKGTTRADAEAARDAYAAANPQWVAQYDSAPKRIIRLVNDVAA